MKQKRVSQILASGGLAALGTILLGVPATARSLTEFDAQDNESMNWRVVDDGVMGGRSQGNAAFAKSGILSFSGELSLENNGGFSSMRTGDLDLDLSDSDGLAVRVKGDGRTYQLRLGSDARYRGMEVSFMAEFPTEKGKWTEVRVPFTDFTGSFRGRTLKNEVLNTARIQRIGLLLADKKAGPFKLEVDWIRAYGGGSGSGTIVDQAVADGRFKTLAAALTEAGLVELLQGEGPFTVFAPTDSAFAKLPEGTVESLLKPENRDQLQAILKYHVSPGATRLAAALDAGSAATAQGGSLEIAFREGQVRVNDAAILDADLEGSNGVIHVIDSVLLPPEPAATTDILGVARSAGNFSTLIAALEAAGLASVLQGEGPFTVLAPTDEAFAALPEGTVEALLKEENLEQLKSVLTFHAFAGRISAGDALNAKSAKTLNGQPVGFAIEDGLLKVNGATIRSTDISCDNGIIHVIDAVLLPSKGGGSKCGGSEASTDPMELIQDAIERGVPIFNHGDHKRCAEIYRACLETLSCDRQIDAEMREALKKVLEHADGEHITDRKRAWIYRGALDSVYQVMMR
jgi:transforming growth factor-beta-induced protein